MAKTDTKNFVVRIDPELHEQVAKLAEEKRRSLNSQTAVILETYFDAQALRDRLAELERNN